MVHLHEVRDSDTHFVIDPVTRAITSNSDKNTLMQGDHNSEIYTFEIPKTVEGHNMSLCNRVEVHYIDAAADKTNTSKDVYIVKDMQPDETEPDTLVFSWLISGNATKFAGLLSFRVRFGCVDDDGNFTYKWHTDIYKGITVSDGFDNAPAVVEEYSDVLAAWEKRLDALESGSAWNGVAESDLEMGGNAIHGVADISLQCQSGRDVVVSAKKASGDISGVFFEDADGSPVLLSNVAPGKEHSDAVTVSQLNSAVAGLEHTENRVTAIDETADDEHYPTAKAVRDYVGNAASGGSAFTVAECLAAGMEEIRRVAEKIGANNSNWIEPVGESNVSTAKDICKVLLYCSGFPKIYDIWNTPQYTARRMLADGSTVNYVANSTVVGANSTALTDHYTVIGGKTGSSSNGIFNLACVVQSNQNPDDWYAVAAMKADTGALRYDAVKQIMDIVDGVDTAAASATDPLDDIAWENLTYREIFIENNWAADINNNDLYYPNKELVGNLGSGVDRGYTVDSTSGSGGHCEIVFNAAQQSNYIPPYSLEVTGTGYRLTTNYKSFDTKLLCACNVNITEYTAGSCGVLVGANVSCALSRATNGYEVVGKVFDGAGAPFIGGNRGFNGTGYVNNPVIVTSDLFATVPTEEEWVQLYQNFNEKLLQSMYPETDIPAQHCCAIKVPAHTARAYQHYDLTPTFEASANVGVIPASVTKLLVAATVLDHIPDLDTKVTITQEDIDLCNPYGGDLRLGDTLTVRDYLYMALLPSSNISATILCRVVGEKVLRSRSL